MFDIVVGVVVLVFIGGLFIVLKNRKPYLPMKRAVLAIEDIEETRVLDPRHAVMDAHKIFVHTLQTLMKKKQTAAKTIKFFSKRFPNTPQVWTYHRLRNQIAHEPKVHVSEHQAREARNHFIRAIKALTKERITHLPHQSDTKG